MYVVLCIIAWLDCVGLALLGGVHHPHKPATLATRQYLRVLLDMAAVVPAAVVVVAALVAIAVADGTSSLTMDK